MACLPFAGSDVFDNRLAKLGSAAAAVFHQIGQQPVHAVHVGEIADGPPFPRHCE